MPIIIIELIIESLADLANYKLTIVRYEHFEF